MTPRITTDGPLTLLALDDLRRRLQAQHAQLAAPRPDLALRAAEGDVAAIDLLANRSTQTEEVRQHIERLDEARPALLAREREAAQRELQAQIKAAVDQFKPMEASVAECLAALKAGSVPSLARLAEFDVQVRVYLRARAALAVLTHNPALAQPRDPLDELRFHFFEQHKERERMFRHVLATRQPIPHAEALNQLVARKIRLEQGDNQ